MKVLLQTILFLIFTAWLLPSCISNDKKLNRRVSFRQIDKLPYGTRVAYEQLPYIFPEAYIEVNKEPPVFSEAGYSTQDTLSQSPETVYMYIMMSLQPDSVAAYNIVNRAMHGEEVFISACYISPTILKALELEQTYKPFVESGDSLSLWIADPVTGGLESFHYPGFQGGNYFSKMDTTVTNVLGTNSGGNPNYVRFSFKSGGNLYLHLAPFAFSNFFLLHRQNKRYYEQVLSYLPETAGYVVWDDYFRNPSARNNNFSALGFLWQQPAFKWAIWMTILLCCLLFLVESGRRQRLIPVITPLRNSSVDFVTTIGRLYFQQKNHKNLAQKMIRYFMDYVRNRYQVTLPVTDDKLAEQLSLKSGKPLEAWKELVEYIREIEYYDSISEEALMELSYKIEQLKK